MMFDYMQNIEDTGKKSPDYLAWGFAAATVAFVATVMTTVMYVAPMYAEKQKAERERQKIEKFTNGQETTSLDDLISPEK